MKTLKLLGAALAAVTMTFTAQAAKTAKAVVEDKGATLRFVYDETNYGTKGTRWFSVAEAETIDPYSENAPWHGCGETVTKVVFDPSFAAYRPKQCGSWFRDFGVLAAVDGLTNLDTSDATSMAYMFSRCSTLTTLDVSGFDTANVTSMYSMFEDCSKLTMLDASGFGTSNVTDMAYMFYGCSTLTTLDVSGFDTANVTSMAYMFYGCSTLTTLDVSGFDTANVTSMISMFSGCSSLTTLNLASFDTANVTSMGSMFKGCSSLVAICASDRFVTDGQTYSYSMFGNCSKLVGGAGTVYDNTKTDKTYAHIDKADQPGYFTRAPTAKAVVADGGKTLRFVYDGKDYGTKDTDWFSVAEAEASDRYHNDAVPWRGKQLTVTKVVFDSSFAAYRPKQCGWWFCYFADLAAVDGLTNLDTSVATNMTHMFCGCSSLTSLDVTGFNTANVTSMAFMFCGCSSLTTLDVSGFDTANVTDMYAMFQDCSSPTTLDVTGFNTANVTNMAHMFYGCSSLEAICASDRFVTDRVLNSSCMFQNCSKLFGGRGTKYNSAKTGKTYARIDGKDGLPGYFTRSPVRDDLNGDGRADIVMTIDKKGHSADGSTGAWLIQSNQTAAWGDLSQRNAGWDILGLGATAPGKATKDVYLVSPANVVGAWTTDASGKVSGWKTIDSFNSATTVGGFGDFNGDGQSDLLLVNDNGAVGCYFTSGSKTGWNYFQSLGPEWQICGIGDLNGDGRDDLVLLHDEGFAGSWLTQADGTMAWADLDTLQPGFAIVGCGDFDGDGTDDVLLKKDSYYGAWLVQDGQARGWMGLGDLGNVTVEQIADFDGDGRDDLRIRTADGDLGAELVKGVDQLTWAYYGSVGPEWLTEPLGLK